jgi:hypothetical protein
MAHLPTSARFRARAPARYPASYARPPGGGTGHAAALSRCLSAAGIRLLGILSRRGLRPSCDRPTTPPSARTPPGFPCSARMRHGWGWAPSIPRGQRCSHDRPEVAGRRLPLPSGQPLSPRSCHPPRGARINGTSARVHWYSPAQPSPHLWPRDGTGALGLSPEAPHPCEQDPQAHVQGGDRSRTLTQSHVPGITGPPPTNSLTNVRPHVATSAPDCPARRHRVKAAPCGRVACDGFASLDQPRPGTHSQGSGAYEEDGEEAGVTRSSSAIKLRSPSSPASRQGTPGYLAGHQPLPRTRRSADHSHLPGDEAVR